MTEVIEVRSPSTAAETGQVLRAVFHIAYWTAIAIALGHHARGAGGAAGGAGASGLQFDEIAYDQLPEAAQRTYRLLREGVATAERTRARTGVWPEVDALVARGVAPFVDPIDQGGYVWTRVQDGVVVDYVGVPAASSGLPTFEVVLLEPDPGTPIDPTAPADEVHHKMPDGTMVHVSLWTAPGAHPASGAVAAPRVEDGWRRIVLPTR